VLCGYPNCSSPAWTLHGKPIPFQDEFGPSGPRPIPVERIRGQLFLDCGEADALWPSCPMARAIDRRRHGRTTLVAFPGAGHGVGDLVPNVPQSFTDLAGLTPQANVDARRRGWPRLLAFLRTLE
jgi:dienelactone hydrolase